MSKDDAKYWRVFTPSQEDFYAFPGRVIELDSTKYREWWEKLKERIDVRSSAFVNSPDWHKRAMKEVLDQMLQIEEGK